MGVSITITGQKSAAKYVIKKGKEMVEAAEKELLKQGFAVEAEVKQSIAGRRAEPRSVDTGRFLNSVYTEKKPNGDVVITHGTGYGDILEYGTSTRVGRKHFTNSASRIKGKVVLHVAQAVSSKSD